jgi:hypothetical protein
LRFFQVIDPNFEALPRSEESRFLNETILFARYLHHLSNRKKFGSLAPFLSEIQGFHSGLLSQPYQIEIVSSKNLKKFF